jgi:hypothetical protein
VICPEATVFIPRAGSHDPLRHLAWDPNRFPIAMMGVQIDRDGARHPSTLARRDRYCLGYVITIPRARPTRPAKERAPSPKKAGDATADEHGSTRPDRPTADPAEVSNPSVKQGPDLVEANDPVDATAQNALHVDQPRCLPGGSRGQPPRYRTRGHESGIRSSITR